MAVRAFPDLPAARVQFLNGNLSFPNPPANTTGEKVLIIGTAVNGPLNNPVNIANGDINTARSLFGNHEAGCNLIKKAAEFKKAAGANAIDMYLMRVGNATKAERTLQDRFGNDSITLKYRFEGEPGNSSGIQVINSDSSDEGSLTIFNAELDYKSIFQFDNTGLNPSIPLNNVEDLVSAINSDQVTASYFEASYVPITVTNKFIYNSGLYASGNISLPVGNSITAAVAGSERIKELVSVSEIKASETITIPSGTQTYVVPERNSTPFSMASSSTYIVSGEEHFTADGSSTIWVLEYTACDANGTDISGISTSLVSTYFRVFVNDGSTDTAQAVTTDYTLSTANSKTVITFVAVQNNGNTIKVEYLTNRKTSTMTSIKRGISNKLLGTGESLIAFTLTYTGASTPGEFKVDSSNSTIYFYEAGVHTAAIDSIVYSGYTLAQLVSAINVDADLIGKFTAAINPDITSTRRAISLISSGGIKAVSVGAKIRRYKWTLDYTPDSGSETVTISGTQSPKDSNDVPLYYSFSVADLLFDEAYEPGIGAPVAISYTSDVTGTYTERATRSALTGSAAEYWISGHLIQFGAAQTTDMRIRYNTAYDITPGNKSAITSVPNATIRMQANLTDNNIVVAVYKYMPDFPETTIVSANYVDSDENWRYLENGTNGLYHTTKEKIDLLLGTDSLNTTTGKVLHTPGIFDLLAGTFEADVIVLAGGDGISENEGFFANETITGIDKRGQLVQKDAGILQIFSDMVQTMAQHSRASVGFISTLPPDPDETVSLIAKRDYVDLIAAPDARDPYKAASVLAGIDSQFVCVTASFPAFIIAEPQAGLGTFIDSMEAGCAAMYATLPPNQALTKKAMPGIIRVLPEVMKFTGGQLNQLVGARLLVLEDESGVIRVVDAPTMAAKDSDYRRLSTVKIVNTAVSEVQDVAKKYRGNSFGTPSRIALQEDINTRLDKMVAAEALRSYGAAISQSGVERANNRATIRLTLAPAFELKDIDIIVQVIV